MDSVVVADLNCFAVYFAAVEVMATVFEHFGRVKAEVGIKTDEELAVAAVVDCSEQRLSTRSLSRETGSDSAGARCLVQASTAVAAARWSRRLGRPLNSD